MIACSPWSDVPTHRSRAVRLLRRAVLLIAFPISAGPLIAQARPDSVRPPGTWDSIGDAARDSLLARLERAEAAIALLKQQLSIEAATTVHTRSRVQVELSGRVLSNAFYTRNRVNSIDVPQVALSEIVVTPAFGSPGPRALGMSVRQTRIGAAMSVDSVLGGRFEGDFDIDFFGGVSNGPGDRRLFPEPRMRVARGRLTWDRTSILVGSETPLISDLNPVSLATVAIPGFVTAGNLWNWIPQVRVSHDVVQLANGVRVGVQGALLSPFTGAQHASEPDAVDAGERSARPYLEGRVHVRWGDADSETGAPSDVGLGERGGEIGIGAHRGWVRISGDSLNTSSAVSLDARVRLGRWAELRGEAYRGLLVRGLGGGAIGQTLGRPANGEANGVPLRDTAGWLQLNVQPHATLTAGAGCGRDIVDDAERPTRSRNTECSTHLLWRPAQPILIGIEARSITTVYSGQSFRASHLNLSFGFEL